MTFKAQMTSDLAVFFNADEFAESVTYTPQGGSSVAVTVVVERKGWSVEEDDVGRWRVWRCVVHARASEIATVTQGRHAAAGDKWSIDSRLYWVESLGPKDEGAIEIDVWHRQRIEASGEGYRA